jgi:aminoglycoside 6'-N-acetyltransferase I
MQIRIRQAKPADRDQLAQRRSALRPKTSAAERARELLPILAGDTPVASPLVNFVAGTADGTLPGFAEVDLRSHADGCNPAHPVGYLEGWYVSEEYRRCGIGHRLLSATEEWFRSHDWVEIASDTWIDSDFHKPATKALGFEVVNRCVHDRKLLW